jgi:hypothetical protein
MGDAAAVGDELAVFMADDWDMFLHAGVTALGDELIHLFAAADERSAAFMKQGNDVAASFAAIEFNFFHS